MRVSQCSLAQSVLASSHIYYFHSSQITFEMFAKKWFIEFFMSPFVLSVNIEWHRGAFGGITIWESKTVGYEGCTRG